METLKEIVGLLVIALIIWRPFDTLYTLFLCVILIILLSFA